MDDGLPTRLHLVRHGRVADPWPTRVYGRLDVPLSPAGEREAARAAERLADVPLAAVVSSGLARAEHGAALLRAGRGLPRRDDPELAEIDRGAWAGLGLDELERREPGAWTAWHDDPGARRPPGGESLEDLARRVLPRIDALARELPGAEVAVVSHHWTTRVVVCAALGLPPGAATRFRLPSGGIATVDWPPEADPDPPLLPTLVGFALDGAPDRGLRWRRGAHRG